MPRRRNFARARRSYVRRAGAINAPRAARRMASNCFVKAAAYNVMLAAAGAARCSRLRCARARFAAARRVRTRCTQMLLVNAFGRDSSAPIDQIARCKSVAAAAAAAEYARAARLIEPRACGQETCAQFPWLCLWFALLIIIRLAVVVRVVVANVVVCARARARGYLASLARPRERAV